MRSRTMRRAAAAMAAGLAVGLSSPATAGHDSAQSPVTIEAKITRSNGAVASADVDPLTTGEWHFVATVSRYVDEVLVQLWKPDGNLCAGEPIAEEALSGSGDKAYHKRHVEPGKHDFSLRSTVDSEHCVRVILWGARGAAVSVKVYEPELVEPVPLPDPLGSE